MIRHRPRLSVLVRFIVGSMCLSFLPGNLSSRTVTLDSLFLLRTHEWLSPEPTVYFRCKGENKTILPDVKKTHVLYTFKGEESWQPLTELPDNKCKRCGLYEKDSIKADDVYDEWELCPDEFKFPDGKYEHFKHKEFNITLLCAQCTTVSGKTRADAKAGGKEMHLIWVILISVSASIVSLVAVAAAYRYWLRKKREQDQARFLKLFEEGDDIEDELGLGTII